MGVILLSGKSGAEPFGHYQQILLLMECFSLSSTDLQKIYWLQLTSRGIKLTVHFLPKISKNYVVYCIYK